MDAKHALLHKSLKLQQQYSVPIYQRKYSWGIDQCKKLLDDIARAGKNNDEYYFIGSLVHVSIPSNPDEIARYTVIDGQQRLTTILLILAALQKTLGISGQKMMKNEIDKYVLNKDWSEAERYKLVLTPDDKSTMECIIDDDVYPNDCSVTIRNNFEFIKDYIKNINHMHIYSGFKKLIVVNIVLERKDRPQLIFESINSTGRRLTKTDLIRNYILMDLPIRLQEKIYEKYWRPMEKNFVDCKVFDEFMKDFLTVKNRNTIKIVEVYEQFKKWRSKQKLGIEKIAKDIKNHSDLFANLVYYRKEDDPDLRKIITNINELKMNVMRPFLLRIMLLHQDEKITKDELRKIFLMVESYMLRRSVCKIPSAGLNKLVPQLISQLDAITINHFDGIRTILLSQKSIHRFPKNDEFKQHFKTINIYNSKIIRYTLFKLENFLRRNDSCEHAYLDNDSNAHLTIEHVMPRNIHAWKKYLSDAEIINAENYIDTIGNLTLTGYNPKMSDKPFSEKLNMKNGFKSSPLLLNQYIKNCTEWRKKQIINRATHLAEKVVTIWERPISSENFLGSYIKNDLTSSNKAFTEKKYLTSKFVPKDISQSIDLFKHTRITISKEFKELEYRPKKLYCGFYIQDHAICSIRILKNSVKLSYNAKNGVLPKTSFIEHFVNEDGISKRSWCVGNYASELKNTSDVNKAIPFIRKILESITS